MTAEWEDPILGCVRAQTASARVGGNAQALTNASLDVQSDTPGQWVVRVLPQRQTGPSAGWVQVLGGDITITEGSIDSNQERIAQYAALGSAYQCRGNLIRVRPEQNQTAAAFLLQVTTSPGSLQTHWAAVINAILGPSGGGGVERLPSFATRLSIIATRSGPAFTNGLDVTFRDTAGNALLIINAAPGVPIEVPIPQNAYSLSLQSLDAVNSCLVAISAEVVE